MEQTGYYRPRDQGCGQTEKEPGELVISLPLRQRVGHKRPRTYARSLKPRSHTIKNDSKVSMYSLTCDTNPLCANELALHIRRSERQYGEHVDCTSNGGSMSPLPGVSCARARLAADATSVACGPPPHRPKDKDTVRQGGKEDKRQSLVSHHFEAKTNHKALTAVPRHSRREQNKTVTAAPPSRPSPLPVGEKQYLRRTRVGITFSSGQTEGYAQAITML